MRNVISVYAEPTAARAFAPSAADDERIGDVIELLKQVARDHRQGEENQSARNIPARQVAIHGLFLPKGKIAGLLYAMCFRNAIYNFHIVKRRNLCYNTLKR